MESKQIVRSARKAAILALILAFVPLLSPAQQPAQSAQPPSAQPQQAPPILPKVFAGWQLQGAKKAGTNPAEADPAFGAVLKELGFTDYETATYKQADATLQIRAARFTDASGAYGAFTFYKDPDMKPVKVGARSGGLGNRVLFYRGNVLIDATVDRPSPTTLGELRELDTDLPQLTGSANEPPPMIGLFPLTGYVDNSVKYAVGPVELGQLDSPIPANLIDFSRDAEVGLAKYRTGSGTVTMILVNYPTQQIAEERLHAFEQYKRSDGQLALVKVKRTGPVVVGITGPISSGDAQDLIGSVNYRENLTWNERVPTGRDNMANLLINVFLLIGIILAFSLVIGIMFGGVRLLAKKFFPNRVFDRPEDVEIIQLKLKD